MRLFLDLDGVFADFDRRVIELTGEHPRAQNRGRMWKTLARTPDFYATLDWMPESQTLWKFCRPFNPTILTGIPMGKWAPGQKRRWVGEQMGWDVPVITCLAKEKFTYGSPGDILLDDTEKNIVAWQEMGGIAILHTDVQKSINELKRLLNGSP